MLADLMAALKAEEHRLVAELEKTTLFQKLEAVRLTIRLYEAQNAVDKNVRHTGSRAGTTSSAVLDGAEDYLRTAGRREMAPGITAELHRRGIVPSTDVQTVRSVASYLSTAKDRFNNVRGQGYGLAEWPIGPGGDEPDSPPGQSPDGEVIPETQTLEEMLG